MKSYISSVHFMFVSKSPFPRGLSGGQGHRRMICPMPRLRDERGSAMKRLFFALFLLVALSGCDDLRYMIVDVRDETMPTDLVAGYQELTPLVARLTPEEQRSLAAYTLSRLSYNSTVPAGTTIRQAILSGRQQTLPPQGGSLTGLPDLFPGIAAPTGPDQAAIRAAQQGALSWQMLGDWIKAERKRDEAEWKRKDEEAFWERKLDKKREDEKHYIKQSSLAAEEQARIEEAREEQAREAAAAQRRADERALEAAAAQRRADEQAMQQAADERRRAERDRY